jgi:hypothetical protein
MNQFYAEQAKLHIDGLKRQQPEGNAELSLPAGNSEQIEQTPPRAGHPRSAGSLAGVLAALGLGSSGRRRSVFLYKNPR